MVLLLVGALALAASLVLPATAAQAANVTAGPVKAQMADHRGVDYGTGRNNCITYAPPGTATSSALVGNTGSSTNEAQTAHGSDTDGTCPRKLSTTTQSTVGFRPSTVTTVSDGSQFLIGRMIHYNNSVYADDEYYTGTLTTVLGGFSTPNTLSFPWTLDETTNDAEPPTSPSNNDVIAFSNQISTVVTQGGTKFRLVITGFVPVANATTCPTKPVGQPVNRFSTVETKQTHACLYASLDTARSLTIVKQVAGTSPAPTSFGFGSTSALAGSPWSNGSFSLSSGGSTTRDLTTGDSVTVTENDPNDDRWSLTGLSCTQVGANGRPEAVPGVTLNLAGRQVTLADVPRPPDVTQPGITCTYTNTYTPKATLTLVKQVASGTAAPSLWTLTATGSVAPPPSGTIVSGPSGSPAVTTQRLPAGTYALSETGTGAASTGYTQFGDWSCRTTGGTAVPVVGASVALPDSAAATSSANVTCTATNRFVTGSLRISKVVDAPTGAYTGGASKTFSGAYDCGSGLTGTFSTLTTGTPVTIADLPAGRSCTVTENTPIGGLLNASYGWGPATFSTQPVTITDGGTASVTITNPVVQRFGTFSVTKTVTGPGGFVGGTDRVFPVGYTCTLTDGPTTSGTLDVTTSQAVSPPDGIPAGSQCAFSENLQPQDGDFGGPSYVWNTPPTITPSSVVIGANATASVTVGNSYTREFGSLVVAKVVDGSGYSGGTAKNFKVNYTCAPGFAGQVTVADGGTTTITGLPARVTCSVQEVTPDAGLLSPAYRWGTPTWSPSLLATIVANGSTTLTVTNPTVPVFGQVRATKTVTGETQGVVSGAQFTVTADCDSRATPYVFKVGVGETASTPDLPVGTSCTVTETPPSDGLLDASYAWGPTPGAQNVTLTTANQVINVPVENTVVRVLGTLEVTKALTDPDGVVDAGRRFALGYSCTYGAQPAVTGTFNLAPGATGTSDAVLVGSQCTVTEDPDTLTDPPSATDPSYVWLPVAYTPSEQVAVTSATAPATVTATNAVKRITGSLNVTKSVVGAGKEGGYTPGSTFGFRLTCAGQSDKNFVLTDGESQEQPTVPASTTCTLTETSKPTVPPAYGWDQVQFVVDSSPQGTGDSVTFTTPADGSAFQVTAINPITPRLGSVRVTKAVTGETAGLLAGNTAMVSLNCGPGRVYELDVPIPGETTQDGIPVGSTCVATESTLTGGLLDASYAWETPDYSPADATVEVVENTTPSIGISNPILRVTAPVNLVKRFVGTQGIIDPDRLYDINWSCTYRGSTVGSGSVSVKAGPDGTVLADDIPVTSTCIATEGDLGTPSGDPAFRWLDPTITGTTVASPGPNTVGVTNTLTRDSGTVLVRKQITGATEGYTGGTDENFTLHGECYVPGQPGVPTRFADGTIADGGEKPIVASIGWTCSGYEDTPSQALLKDTSYAWGAPVYDPAGSFVLTRAKPEQVFLAQNPIVRVRSSLTIEKAVRDSFGVVDPNATFTGTYSCQYGTDDPVTGTWSITPGANAKQTVDGLLLGSKCTVTENTPAGTGLPDSSYSWAPAVVGPPATVEAGGTTTVQVTNSVQRLYAGLQLSKTLTDPAGGVKPGTKFAGVWTCAQGTDTYSDRFSVTAGTSTVLFTPEDARVPATSVCSVQEDTLNPDVLVDGSFDWGPAVYTPDTVTLITGETASLAIANTVIRVYSDVQVQKAVTGPGADLGADTRDYTGTLSCRYGDDDPVVTTWQARPGAPWLASGILVGSVCNATENLPGSTGQPVDNDDSYVWGDPVVIDPVTVTPPATPTPPLRVLNPIERQFGTFSMAKEVVGDTEGILDPAATFPMSWTCQPGVGDAITGDFSVARDGTAFVGQDPEIPVDSTCTVTEPAEALPALQDAAWAWSDPEFTIAPVPAEPLDAPDARSVTFVIPRPQEDTPVPNVDLVATNTVTRTDGAYSVSKSSDPASGTQVAPGSNITYSVTLDSTGTVPVHEVVVVDDLTAVLTSATLAAITPPAGTSVAFDVATGKLVWTVGTLTKGAQLTLKYAVRVNDDAYSQTLRNSVTSTGDVPPTTCAGTAPLVSPTIPGGRSTAAPAASGVSVCSTEHTTPPKPTPPPTVPPTAPPAGPSLPITGSSVGILLGSAAALLLVGGGLLVVDRRRRRQYQP
ncbi:hypothetical protein BA895_02850 [Humibacillus sp. DSM 29435]|nr:hypothetical protein BA895_02850 [Humibacillus sp. DSM 29435]